MAVGSRAPSLLPSQPNVAEPTTGRTAFAVVNAQARTKKSQFPPSLERACDQSIVNRERLPWVELPEKSPEILGHTRAQSAMGPRKDQSAALFAVPYSQPIDAVTKEASPQLFDPERRQFHIEHCYKALSMQRLIVR